MAVVLRNKGLIAIVPPAGLDNPQVVAKALGAKVLTYPDGEVWVCRHSYDAMKILNNINADIRGCGLLESYYTPPVVEGKTAWWWQLETANFLVENSRAFVTSTPRTGKTLSTLLAVDFIQQSVKTSALIVAPLTVANGGEWAKTLEHWFPHKKVQLVHANRDSELDTGADIFLINPDGLKLVENKLTQMVNTRKIGIVIFDELTEYGNANSKRWKSAKAISNNAVFRWGLTGTPSSVDKIYAQVKLINEHKVPSWFGAWRSETMTQVTQHKWIPKKGHEERVKRAMSPCIRFDKAQLLKIPQPKEIFIDVPLSEKQQNATQALLDDAEVYVGGELVKASTVMVMAMKALQIAAGVVRVGEDGGTVSIDATPKLEKLVELIKSTPRKKVVFSNFTAVNDMLVAYLNGLGITTAKIDGGVSGARRSKLLQEFMDTPHPHVLVCHPRTTAYGVELASADALICYGAPMAGSYLYQQMAERLSSARQTAEETFIYHLSAGVVDKQSFKSLSQGVDVERKLVQIFTRDVLHRDVALV